MGIDPGTTTVGYGIIEKTGKSIQILDYGTIETPPKSDHSLKLLDIAADLETLVRTYRVDLCGIERLFFFKNITNAMSVAEARGVITYVLAKSGIPIVEFTPLQVKLGICGSGRAPKKQVQNAVKILYGLEEIPKPDDAADALAIAYITSLQPSSLLWKNAK